MEFEITGKDLFNWYQSAKRDCLNNKINISELNLFITELTSLNKLDLQLNNYQNKDLINSKFSLDKLEKIWSLRITKRCPIQYLIGECHWRNFSLKVTPDVLIPRPETELIIDLASEITFNYSHLKTGNFLDLGTGSGAIALGLAEAFPNSYIYAVDKSKSALKIAQENALKYGFESRIKFCHGSWFEPINDLRNSFSLIVSNPPYIPSQMVLELEPEVVNHEPKIALDGGEDGLKDIRYLIKNAPNFLVKDGFLILEIMAGQGKIVKNLLKENGSYKNIRIEYDLAGLDRFAIGVAT
ncbi:peptide chain release factor N(5)-glutamine methyltransferase [Cyanobacterium aponinum FACHB-4101]|uniref:peptide chain release factor N(5)-glutamine methyltransferase n=1 Tax=Cyanobacterium aponinum TaxID=379064 RepID=UPI001680124F|nr:peptide chain release factor N(5)-glutamine methyltransferase [Cyanobacterium aponinum]MBD2394498.1 peptide chain release factor N(5)-glutamine methyltransferase [Cyanobacterium aponinum FACHB-4101]